MGGQPVTVYQRTTDPTVNTIEINAASGELISVDVLEQILTDLGFTITDKDTA